MGPAADPRRAIVSAARVLRDHAGVAWTDARTAAGKAFAKPVPVAVPANVGSAAVGAAAPSVAPPASATPAPSADPSIPTLSVSDLPRAGRRKHHRRHHGKGVTAKDDESDVVDKAEEKAEGLLTVVCYPACDEVTVDGRAWGPSPIFKEAVTPGAHKLVLKTADPPVTREVDVNVGTEEPAIVRQQMTR